MGSEMCIRDRRERESSESAKINPVRFALIAGSLLRNISLEARAKSLTSEDALIALSGLSSRRQPVFESLERVQRAVAAHVLILLACQGAVDISLSLYFPSNHVPRSKSVRPGGFRTSIACRIEKICASSLRHLASKRASERVSKRTRSDRDNAPTWSCSLSLSLAGE